MRKNVVVLIALSLAASLVPSMQVFAEDEIIVTGTKRPTPKPPSRPDVSPEHIPNSAPKRFVQNEHDTSPEQTEEEKCKAEQSKERERDAVAGDAADEIRSKPDWRNREYGTAIYQGPNGVRYDSPVARGTRDNVNIPVRRREGERVVGTLHSHPRNSSGAPSDGDWNMTDQILDPRAGRGNENDFSVYVLNFDDRNNEADGLAEFDPTRDRSQNKTKSKHIADALGKCDGK